MEEGGSGMLWDGDLLFQPSANIILRRKVLWEDYGKLSGHLWPRRAVGKASVPGTLWVALLTPSPRDHFCFLSSSFQSDENGMGSPFSSPFIHLSLGPFQKLLSNVIEGEELKVTSGPTSRKCH